MRKINNLTDSQTSTLEAGYKNSPKAHFRNRCQAILLSSEGYKVSQIAALFKVRTRTIYTWFDNWETYGISGLILLSGRGVKAKLDKLSSEQINEVKEAVKKDAQSLKTICENLTNSLGFTVTKHMLKRFLKKTQLHMASI